ncbi:hypothetical protein EHQ53_06700 [Leptospira langatensis]|uniref:Uncharacterized protein n=1 Tax=Leptospira langatensis TaxID=2484983 RepID=A0A5F1ZTL7_9LEPT|nr:hypothetical protein [Leptospira langatensis]TGK03132.1 hypothetical protein EHO57_07530 [Leptospira langatensis]TGL41889.1 hypothetical protein EHQ53_06700 [Leptospira langatensis]
MKKRTLVFLYLLLPALLFSDSQVTLPRFQLQDQKGVAFSSSSVKGNTYFLLGCGFRDIVLCRKHGRKIYWKMQTLLKDEDKVIFSAYLDLKNAPQTVFDYILQEKDKDYESILLDKQGILSLGLVGGKSYLRVYSPKGSLLHSEYFQTVDDAKVLELFEFVKKGRRK